MRAGYVRVPISARFALVLQLKVLARLWDDREVRPRPICCFFRRTSGHSADLRDLCC
jgi:hypothetical protein